MNSRLLRIVIGSLVFGALMGWRSQLEAAWAKNLVAGAAGGVMGALLYSNLRWK